MKLMTIKEVTEYTGVTRDTLLHYDEKKLLIPKRSTDGLKGRVYSEEDLERLKQILVFRSYGFSLEEIKAILDGTHEDLKQALEDHIQKLKAEQNRLQNLILFTKYIDITDENFIEGLAFGPDDIDKFCDLIRSSEAYQESLDLIESLNDAEAELIWDELQNIIEDFTQLEELDGFSGVESAIDSLLLWWEKYFTPSFQPDYFSLISLIEDSEDLFSEIEEVGGEGTAAFLQMNAFYLWMRNLMRKVTPIIQQIAKVQNEDVVLASDIVKNLVFSITDDSGIYIEDKDTFFSEDPDISRSNVMNFVQSLLSYMLKMVEDDELMEYIDRGKSIDMRPEDLKKTLNFIEVLAE